MSKTAPDVWTDEPDDTWPIKGGEAAEGTSGVVEAVKSGEGTIGYADASQAKGLGIADIQVGNEFVAPSAEGATAVVDESKEDTSAGQYVYSYEINRTTTSADSYPLILVSYEAACTTYDSDEEATNVNGYLDYIISPEGQDAAAQSAGSAPISDQLREQIQPAVDAIGS
jgi:phosphate transport system substrate-binding protein